MKATCGQMRANTIDQAASVWPVVERHAAEARRAGADLLVLPETTYPAYWLESADRYMQPDIERSADVLTRFGQIARRHGIWLVAGFVEEREGKLHNSAAVFDRRGDLVTIARKSFLWDCDNRWFTPGWQIAAFDSEFGRIGVLICADCRAPEITATLVADGATMLLLPTAWVNAGQRGSTYRNVHPEFMIRARALEFGVPFVCCSKSGPEGDKLEYVGRSRIVSATGDVLAEATIGGEELIVADLQQGNPLPPRISNDDLLRLFAPVHSLESMQRAGEVQIAPADPLNQIRKQLEDAGARIIAFEADDARSFVQARCAALAGAAVIVFDGPLADESLLRARAAENRVFVIAGNRSGQIVISPDGSVIWTSQTSRGTIHLDLAQADVKLYTPATDLWVQRRVACYRLGQPNLDVAAKKPDTLVTRNA